ncbi:MAG: UbiD family decarboxylase domain-containing protein, partial [Candidatus Binatia bacterium]
MAKPESEIQEDRVTDDLHAWLNHVEGLGQLERIVGAHWDLEVGALAEIVLERLASPPALIFEGIPGHYSNSRILTNMLESIERVALTLNLPMDLKPIPFIDTLRDKLRHLQPPKPRLVSYGPILEEQETGDDVDILKFPVPRWHEGDGGRYLGTAHLVITRDPETEAENVGCYRVMVHGKDRLGLYISPGKHGRIHLEKGVGSGRPFPIAIVFGEHPLLFIAASQAVPFGMSEYEWAGGIIG